MLGQLQGRPTPTVVPEAELWFGAHPQAPSSFEIGGETFRLDTYLREHQLEELGPDVSGRFGRLPFLLKLLAVEQPLSIQVHPSAEQAKAGFDRERARGIAIDDAHANYRDDWPKPELLCPLTPFEALCGFRPTEELIAAFEALGGDCFGHAAATLASAPNADGLRQLTMHWLSATGGEKTRLYESGLAACSSALARSGSGSESARFVCELSARYPGDMGVLVALLLQRWSLQPGDGLFVPPGVLHAYVKGFAVEVMATSDNVLRGGLTPKHIDLPELLNIVNFAAAPVRLAPTEARGPLETAYVTDSPQFRFSTIEVRAHASYCARPRVGPEMLLCLEGNLDLVGARRQQLELSRGQCALISANEDVYCVAGAARAARVQVGA